MIWRPHTDAPGAAENALIAVRRDEIDPDGPFLVGLAENRNGVWCGEDTGEPIAPPFWWMDERELVALIPR